MPLSLACHLDLFSKFVKLYVLLCQSPQTQKYSPDSPHLYSGLGQLNFELDMGGIEADAPALVVGKDVVVV